VLQCVAVCCSVLQFCRVCLTSATHLFQKFCCSWFWCVAVSYSVSGVPDVSYPLIPGSMLQHVAACWSMLQHVAVCCSRLLCVIVYRKPVVSYPHIPDILLQHDTVCGSMLQYVAVCCSMLQCVAMCRVCQLPIYSRQCAAVCCRVMQCVAVCGSVVQCIRCAWRQLPTYSKQFVAARYSVLQYVATWCSVLDVPDVSYPLIPGSVLQHVTVCCSILPCGAVCDIYLTSSTHVFQFCRNIPARLHIRAFITDRNLYLLEHAECIYVNMYVHTHKFYTHTLLLYIDKLRYP